MKSANHTRGLLSRGRQPPHPIVDPFVYMIDDDLMSIESSKICQPRSTKAFQALGMPSQADMGSPCQCITFLDPFPSPQSAWRSAPKLSHYCRVCNTQLNSCKQSTIHVEGKKHAKRLEYLKFCVEASAQNSKEFQPASNNVGMGMNTTSQQSSQSNSAQQLMQASNIPQAVMQPASQAMMQSAPQSMMQSSQSMMQSSPSMMQSAPQTMMQSAPQTLMQSAPQAMMQSAPQAMMQSTSQQPTTSIQASQPTFAHPSQLTLMPQYMAYGNPMTTTSTAYYYPTCYQTYAQQPQTVQAASYQVPLYQEFVSPPPQASNPPLALNTMLPPPPPPQSAPSNPHFTTPTQGMPLQQMHNQQKMNEAYHSMYPMSQEPKPFELTNPSYSIQYTHYESPRKVMSSGYGSSSAASTISPPCPGGSKGETSSSSINSNNKSSSDSRIFLFCDLCQMSFPSQAMLETHVNGPRHNRRQLEDVKQQSNHQGGSITCEVCKVIVNSSQQLQGHLEGHKHRVRCFRRGIHPSNVMTATPSSSTPPSTAPSECSSSLPNSQVATPSSKCHSNTQPSGRSTTNSSNNNSCSNVSSSSNNKMANSLLGRPRPIQPNLMKGAGLMGVSPHLPATAIITSASFLRRSVGSRSGGGLLPLPLPNKLTGLLGSGSSVQFTRVNRSNTGSKSKGRKPNRSARCQDNHDSTTESDDPASTDGSKKKDAIESSPSLSNNGGNIIVKDSPLSSSTSSANRSCGGDNSKLGMSNNDSSSDEAKESEGDPNESQVLVKLPGSPPQGPVSKMSFSCQKCDIRVNSAIQLAQHLKSPKHHVKGTTTATEGNSDSEVGSPMLNMFLKTLQTPTTTFFSSDKEGEESSNTEVER